MPDFKVDPNKKDLIKKFSITKEEKDVFQTIQSILAIYNMERDAMTAKLVKHAIEIRKRLGINEADAPQGYQRFMDFDPVTYEMLVIDRPVIEVNKEVKPEVKPVDPKVN